MLTNVNKTFVEDSKKKTIDKFYLKKVNF